ncbi:MAG: hypothetical protein LBG44_04485 [Gemmatimonadota bacterium]|nr:hypothetical protein [Gemmatimonadota bacterium]
MNMHSGRLLALPLAILLASCGASDSTSPARNDEPLLSARATVTEVAAIRGGFLPISHVRVALCSDKLYFTQPSPSSVSVIDLTSGLISPLFSSQRGFLTAIACDASGEESRVISIARGGIFSEGGVTYLFNNDSLYVSTRGIMRYSPVNTITQIKMLSSNEFIASDWDSSVSSIWTVRYDRRESSDTLDVSAEIINSEELGDYYSIVGHTSIAVSPQTGAIYVFRYHALWRFDSQNQLELIAGQKNVRGYRDAQGADALFSTNGFENPIAVDFDENIYVADQGSGTIRKVDVNGNVSTVVGNVSITDGNPAPSTGRGDGVRFGYFQDIAFDPVRNALWVVALNPRNRVAGPYSIYRVLFEQ